MQHASSASEHIIDKATRLLIEHGENEVAAELQAWAHRTADTLETWNSAPVRVIINYCDGGDYFFPYTDSAGYQYGTDEHGTPIPPPLNRKGNPS